MTARKTPVVLPKLIALWAEGMLPSPTCFTAAGEGLVGFLLDVGSAA